MKVLYGEAEKSGGVQSFEQSSKRKYIKRTEDRNKYNTGEDVCEQ